MKTLLVTGGAGFIGSNFIIYMLGRYPDYKIINLDRLTYAGNLENLNSVKGNENHVFVHGDICDREIVEDIFNKYDIDCLVNFAAESHVDRSIANPDVFVGTNALGTANLLNVSRKFWQDGEGSKPGRKFLQISTDEVYGSLGENGYFTESTLLDPHSPYAASKASADMLVKSYFDTYRLPVNITRCSNNYGPRQFTEKLIPFMINNIIKNMPLPLYGDGLNIRDWLHVRDHCTAVDLVLHRGRVGEIYNIGGGNEYTNIRIVKMIIGYFRENVNKSISEDMIRFVEDRKGHDRRYATDAGKIRAELGWYPRIVFEEGLKETIKWYVENATGDGSLLSQKGANATTENRPLSQKRSGHMKRNALVAQSGGPSPVINSSLQGVIDACFSYSDHIGRVYASWHGIEGVLLEELIDMNLQPKSEIELLRHTPAAGSIGTCRYKLGGGQEEDFDRIVDIIRAHDIGYFFYIGGNDSMDTAGKVSRLAAEKGVELIVAGVPKTIDNDIGDDKFTIIDHTPGYGSAARYWAYLIQNVNEENRGMCVSESVAVLQAMGRKSGFITAAARLGDPDREMPLQLYMAESEHNLDTLAENVNRQLQKSGRCIVVVNEGFDVGNLGEARDGFGHVEYGSSQITAAQVVTNHLNRVGLKARGQASGQVPGVLQRSVSIHASRVDLEEAYEVGKKAVDIAVKEGTGWMATILRAPGAAYRVVYDKVPLETVANSVRFIPKDWITKDGIDVTDDFIRYAMPLIGDGWPDIRLENGLQRFARLDVRFIDRKLPDYIPQRFRRSDG